MSEQIDLLKPKRMKRISKAARDLIDTQTQERSTLEKQQHRQALLLLVDSWHLKEPSSIYAAYWLLSNILKMRESRKRKSNNERRN